jgi:hypothetical protein
MNWRKHVMAISLDLELVSIVLIEVIYRNDGCRKQSE